MASGSSTEQGMVSVTGSASLRNSPVHPSAAVSKNTGADLRASEGGGRERAAKRAVLDADTTGLSAQIKTLASDTGADTPRCSCF
jgi:hypothetical protein